MKGETIQKLVLFGAMSLGALLVAEGYLRVRSFVDRVDATDKQVAVLKQEVDFLRVQLDVVPRPGAQPSELAAAALAQPQPQPQPQPQSLTSYLPIPEPMRFSPAGQDRTVKVVRTKETAAPDPSVEPTKADAIPDDGKIVLMKDAKEPKASAAPAAPSAAAPPAVATPTVDVKLWPKK
jgi:hypothetical protein